MVYLLLYLIIKNKPLEFFYINLFLSKEVESLILIQKKQRQRIQNKRLINPQLRAKNSNKYS